MNTPVIALFPNKVSFAPQLLSTTSAAQTAVKRLLGPFWYGDQLQTVAALKVDGRQHLVWS